MLRPYLYLLAICFAVHWATAQSKVPQVPSKMELADMKLTITTGGQADIQRDVNMLRASDRYFKVKLDRVALYMPIIERIFKEEGIPDDFKYLVIQESALISDAVSASNAVGFWQFKDFTAKEVGMRVDKKVDERKNIVSSTQGAAKYFWSHQNQLGNWGLTVLAHMTGAEGIKKYIKKGDHGSKKMTIDKKSHWYLKRFLAHKIAFQDHLDHQHSEGLSLLEYTKGGGKTLNKVSKDFDVTLSDLKAYNKWLLQDQIPTDKRYTVTIPVAEGFKPKKDVLADQGVPAATDVRTEPEKRGLLDGVTLRSPFATDEAQIKVNGVPAIVAKEGETFNDLVVRSGLTMTKFLKINDLEKERIVLPGDIYFVKKKKAKSVIGFHVVNPGDSFWQLSQQYGIRMSKLASNNRMSLIDELKPGRVLWMGKKRPNNVDVEYREVPQPKEPKPAPTIARQSEAKGASEQPSTSKTPSMQPVPQQTTVIKTPVAAAPILSPPPSQNEKGSDAHVVQAGETLWRISKLYEVDVASLREWNGLQKNDPIKPGQKLVLKKGTTT
ncbi:MAG: LysM peptidoglycan-binding domain-containing protein, partial [Bacteroidota bacterium]